MNGKDVKDYILFTGFNTDEIRDFVSDDGEFKIDEIREGDSEHKIPGQYSFELIFNYIGGQKSVELHPTDYLIKFRDKARNENYYGTVKNQNWESSKKYLGIRED